MNDEIACDTGLIELYKLKGDCNDWKTNVYFSSGCNFFVL